MNYYSPSNASTKLHVTTQTLRRWAAQGKIQFITTDGGHRRYYIPPTNTNGQRIIYCRVSSKKQKADLQRQIKLLRKKYPSYQLVTDIASGLNYKRPGLNSILEQLFNHDLKEVVVAHKDRLTRFSFDLLQWIFFQFGAKITVLQSKNCSPQQELVEDLIAITTVFSARIHGSRKYKVLT